MKMYKSLLLLMVCCLTLACSQDTFEDQKVDDSSAKLAAEQYDNSYLGVYKGLFTTNDGLIRGSVIVNLTPNAIGTAKLTLVSGEVIELQSGSPKLTVDNTVSNLHFSSIGLSSSDVVLNFSVEADGVNPVVSNVVFNTLESDILIAKNLSRAPLTTITGTYIRTSGTGSFATSGRTWNVMSIGSGDQNFAVQIAYGGVVYNSPAGSGMQSGCVDNGSLTTCNIAGTAQILNYDVMWSGTHSYSSASNEMCSSVSGTWSAPGYGNSSGTFQSDSNCSGALVANDVCANATSIAIGASVSGSTTNATNTGAPSPACSGIPVNTAPSVWYKFVGNGLPITINTNGSNFDTVLSLMTGSCGVLTCIDADDNDGTGNQSLLNLLSTAGQTYYILVTGFGTASGNFNLNINLMPFTSVTNRGCGQSVVDNGGTNGNYGNNRYDVYYIDAGAGMKARLSFTNAAGSFNMEEGYDFLRVYDGNSVTSPQITMTTTGTSAGPNGFTGTNGANSLRGKTVASTGRYLTVAFISDEAVTAAGFNGSITCVAGRQNIGLQQTELTYKPIQTEIVPVKQKF